MTPISGSGPLSVVFSNTTTGSVASWLWDFGDESKPSSAKSPTYTYRKDGSFVVTLSAIGPGGMTTKVASRPVVVRAPAKPIAKFSISRTSGTTPLAVAFTNATTGQVDSWTWDFGDGTTSAEKSPTHVYTALGEYTVKLIATGLGGSSPATAATPIKVSVPQATFSVSRVSGLASLAVRFTNSTTGQVNSWAWDFGDGQTSTDKSPLHVAAVPM
jgi:PKD repeat protein